jgi:group I intron endonuclease
MIVEKKPGIYLIFCLANQRVYIGQSKNVKARLGQHQASLRGNRHSNDYLQKAYNKYGVDMFVFRPCEYPEDTSPENLTAREKYWIEQFDSMNPRRGFNHKQAGPSGTYSEEARAKMSAAHTGKPSNRKGHVMSDEQKQKLKGIGLGRKTSDETKAKLSIANKDQKNPPITEETRAKMSKSQRCKPPISEETRAKMSEANKRNWEARRAALKESSEKQTSSFLKQEP